MMTFLESIHRLNHRWGSSLVVFAMSALVIGCASSKRLSAPEVEKPKEEDKIDPFAFTYYSNGTIYFMDGRYEEAAEEWSKALKYDPQSTEIRLSLAEAFFRLRKFNRATATAEAIVPRTAPVWEFLGKCYRFTGRASDAAIAYSEVIRRDSTNVEALWYLARLDLRQGRYDEAIGYMESVAELRQTPSVFEELADLYLRRGRRSEAVGTLLRSIELDATPENRESFVKLVRIYESTGQFNEAASVLRTMIDVMPEDLAAHKQLVTMLLRAGETRQAIAAIEDILETNPRDPERLRLGIIYYNIDSLAIADSLFQVLDEEHIDDYLVPYYLGRIAHDRGNYDDARGEFLRSVQVNDTIPDAWIQLANTYAAQDSLQALTMVGYEAMEVLPDPKPISYFVGVSLSRVEQYDSAITWLDRAVDEENPDTRALFALASAYERSGQFDSAETQFRRLLVLEPENHAALNYLSYMFAEKGVKLDEALVMIERALKAEPKNGAYLDTYGWVLYKLGRLEDAEDQIRRALEVLDTDAIIWEHLGDILEQLGRPDEARDKWTRALEMDPENDTLRIKLRQE